LPAKNSSLEAQIANLADEITYYSPRSRRRFGFRIVVGKGTHRQCPRLGAGREAGEKRIRNLPDESRRYFTIRTIIDMQIRDVVENSERLITKAGVESADEVRLCARALVQHSSGRAS